MKNAHPFLLNGQRYIISTKVTISDLIQYFGYNGALIIIEYNHSICKNNKWNTIFIKENDRIEIVTIVGGG